MSVDDHVVEPADMFDGHWRERADINKITHENAIECYSFDPFAHRPKEC